MSGGLWLLAVAFLAGMSAGVGVMLVILAHTGTEKPESLAWLRAPGT